MTKANRTIARRARERRRRHTSSCLPLGLAASALLAGLVVVVLLLALRAYQAAEQPRIGDQAPTVLILGVDRRADESGPTRTDSMLLLGSQPTTGQAALLSIPRDLWVTIPGIGEQRINTTLVFGHDPDDPTAGPRLAKTTVAELFGLPVDRYLVLDFDTFVRLVDTLGGVEVDVPAAIVDTQYPTPDYGVTTIRFEPGRQPLDGEQALIYVRTRHVDGDFGRSQRQQQVLQSLAARLLEPATWARVPQLLAVLREGVQTDLTPADWLALLPVTRAVAQGHVQTATLEDGYTAPWTTPGGAWVLLPAWPAIDELVARLFGPR